MRFISETLFLPLAVSVSLLPSIEQSQNMKTPEKKSKKLGS